MAFTCAEPDAHEVLDIHLLKSDCGIGESESSSRDTSTADDENSDDSNARAKHSVTCKSPGECNAGLD